MLQNIVITLKALFNIHFDLVFLRLGENFNNSLQPHQNALCNFHNPQHSNIELFQFCNHLGK